jgi:hypothetical protein
VLDQFIQAAVQLVLAGQTEVLAEQLAHRGLLPVPSPVGSIDIG